MKIHQLPMGARFEYAGQEYVKTGPIFGTGPNGQKLIPKYAVLKPLGETEPPPAEELSGTLERAEVLRAFEAFYAKCGALVPEERREALEAARDEFLMALGR